jgi:hypothetical protein
MVWIDLCSFYAIDQHRVHLRTMPMAAPIRIEAKEAGNAAVELMASSPVMGRAAQALGVFVRAGATRDDLLRRNSSGVTSLN